MEGMSDIDIWSAEFRGGQWSEAVRRSQDPSRSEQNPQLFYTPQGEEWLLYTAQKHGQQDTAVVRVQKDKGVVAQLFAEAGIFIRQPLQVLANGDWLLPAYYCVGEPGVAWRGDHDVSFVMRSSDQGATWQQSLIPASTGLVHPNIVQGGDQLYCFFRSRYADWVYRSHSSDEGKTWSAPVPTDMPNNNSSIQVIRLHSGQLAMVCNPTQASDTSPRRESLYDELPGGEGEGEGEGQSGGDVMAATQASKPAIWGTPRAPMILALSSDQGMSWPTQYLIEDGDGNCLSNNSKEAKNRELSYPSVVQDAEGIVHIAYTRFRQTIRTVSLRLN
jgi:predicted neuraminidase